LGYDLWWHTPPVFNPQNFFGVTQNIYGKVASFNMLGVPKGVELKIPAQFLKIVDSGFHPLRVAAPTQETAGQQLQPSVARSE
jgi:hypothetical protein